MPRAASVPGTVTAAAIILFVYGGLFLFCGLCGTLPLALPDPGGGRDRMNAILAKDAPAHQIVQFGSLALTSVAYLGMILAGVGVLRLSQIGRIAAFLFIFMDLFVSICAYVYQFMIIGPVTQRFVEEELQNQQKAGAPPMPFDMGALMSGATAVGIIIVLLVKLAFCTPILVMLITKSARDAFAGKLPADAPSGDDDEERRKRLEGYDDDDYGSSRKEPKSPGDTGITDRP